MSTLPSRFTAPRKVRSMVELRELFEVDNSPVTDATRTVTVYLAALRPVEFQENVRTMFWPAETVNGWVLIRAGLGRRWTWLVSLKLLGFATSSVFLLSWRI